MKSDGYVLENTKTNSKAIKLNEILSELEENYELLENILTPLENYVLSYILFINKPFSIGKIHNSLVYTAYHLWHTKTLHEQVKTDVQNYKQYGSAIQKLKANIFPNTIYNIRKEKGFVILKEEKEQQGFVIARKAEEMTYNAMKEVLSHKEVKISIPSFNRIKRALETFTDWEIITKRETKGNKASNLYVLTIAFQKGFRETLNKHYNSEKAKESHLLVEILNEEAS